MQMKKILIFLVLSVNVSVFAYTSANIKDAEFLARRGVINQQDTVQWYRLDSPLTRAELVKIALILKKAEAPSMYQCRGYFADVMVNDWVCRAVEMAAAERLISTENLYFRPQGKITKAEAVSILIKTQPISFIGQPRLPIAKFDIRFAEEDLTYWQEELIQNIYSINLIFPSSYLNRNTYPPVGYFYPNKVITRAEAFEFIVNMLHAVPQAVPEEMPNFMPTTTDNFRFSRWVCHDGTTTNNENVSSCKTTGTWRQYAESDCAWHCSNSTGKCGVNTFTAWNECTDN